jgi:hypothetical protein
VPEKQRTLREYNDANQGGASRVQGSKFLDLLLLEDKPKVEKAYERAVISKAAFLYNAEV